VVPGKGVKDVGNLDIEPDAALEREEDDAEELDANLSRDSTISSKTT